jgi:VanZ family protein
VPGSDDIPRSRSDAATTGPPWRRRLEDWSPVFLYTTLIATVSSIPMLAPPTAGFVGDKAYHVAEYAGWALLFRRALDRGQPVTSHRALKMVVTIVLGGLLAVADENFQRRVGRQYAVEDMAADLLGVVVALPVYELLSARVRKVRREAIHRSPGDPGGMSS